MEKAKKKAIKILDLVEDYILESQPLIKKVAEDGKLKGNTLLYGDSYYKVEDKVTKLLKKRW